MLLLQVLLLLYCFFCFNRCFLHCTVLGCYCSCQRCCCCFWLLLGCFVCCPLRCFLLDDVGSCDIITYTPYSSTGYCDRGNDLVTLLEVYQTRFLLREVLHCMISSRAPYYRITTLLYDLYSTWIQGASVLFRLSVCPWYFNHFWSLEIIFLYLNLFLFDSIRSRHWTLRVLSVDYYFLSAMLRG